MHKSILLVCGVCCAVLVSCQRPAEESKAKFPRKANIERYVQKAKDASRLAEDRKKELPVENIVDISVLSNTKQEIKLDFLTHLFEKNKLTLETRLLETHKQKISDQLSELISKNILQSQQAISDASTTTEISEKLNQVLATQEKEFKDFIELQKSVERLTPDQGLLDNAKAYLSYQTEQYVAQIAQEYGAESAELMKPVFEKAVQDYVYAMASASNQESLQQKITEIVQQAQTQLQDINATHADPLASTEEEKITSLRAEMITIHQNLESYVESLYGKEAVLQTRKIFNEILDETGDTLRQNSRLSQKKQILENLNTSYRQKILDLQKKWNLETIDSEDKKNI